MNLHFTKAKLAAFVRSATLVLSLLVTLLPQLIVPAMADVGVGINGGVLADAGAFHVEFIGGAAYALMMFAVSDERQKPVPAREISAYAVVAQNGQTTRLRLSPEADNLLAAMPALPLVTGTTVLVVAKLASGETLTTRFVSP
jgi:hypothetical protein